MLWPIMMSFLCVTAANSADEQKLSRNEGALETAIEEKGLHNGFQSDIQTSVLYFTKPMTPVANVLQSQ